VLQLRAQVQGGGGGGVGLGGDRKDDAFHKGAAGAIYGGLVGVEILFIDVWVEHSQHLGSDGLIGTWTQFMTGLDLVFDIGAKTEGVTIKDGKDTGGYSKTYGELGMAVGFGVGTGQQIDPPLDNSEITDKGFLAQGMIGFGYRFNKAVSVGLSFPVQAGYLIKSGEGVANDLGTHYQSLQAAALLNLRLNITIK
jgi:hypothetical protein